MKTVPLYGKKAAGRVALVDDEDHELVMQYRWNLLEHPPSSARWRPNGPYAYTSTSAKGGRKQGAIFMHNMIMGIVGVDHVNHDGLDNRRSNLRPATVGQNAGNRRKQLRATSQYKGVSWHKGRNRWNAVIGAGGVRRWLGSYGSEIDAARAYDDAARELYGAFACVNFPRPGERGALASDDGATLAAAPAATSYVPDHAGTSRYRGVHWDSGARRWRTRARNGSGGGSYVSEIQAAIAHDAIAIAALGSAAVLNFPNGVDPAAEKRLQAEAGVTVDEVMASAGRGRTASLKDWWSRRETETRVCVICGLEYSSRATQASRYCGEKCRGRARRDRDRLRQLELELAGRLF